MGKTWFYAVARGRTAGVVTSWEECSTRVKGFKGARYKKFASIEEAETFVNKGGEIDSPPTFDGRPSGSSESPVTSVPPARTFSTSTAAAAASLWTYGSMQQERKSWAMVNCGSELCRRHRQHIRSNLKTIESATDSLAVSLEKASRQTAEALKNSVCLGLKELHSIGRRLAAIVLQLEVTETEAPSETQPPAKKQKKHEGNTKDDNDLKVATIEKDWKLDENGYVDVWTDGSCQNNGRKRAKAGLGVWWGHCHPMNVAEPVRGNKATNNVGEIQAATRAVRQAREAGIRKLRLNTDSKFLIQCMTEWLPGWKCNNWKTSKGETVKCRQDLEDLDAALQNDPGDLPLHVTFQHVRGHIGVEGNEMADLLARQGAQSFTCLDEVSNTTTHSTSNC